MKRITNVMKRITNVTKRQIKELFKNGIEIGTFDPKTIDPIVQRYTYWGSCKNELSFLKRLYPIEEMPSYDNRYKNAEDDIIQHTINNDDWELCWVFEDDRFPLQNGTDDDYLKFIVEIFHPEVRDEIDVWKMYYEKINTLLKKDNYELYPKGQISGKDVYGWRDLKEPRFHRLKKEEIPLFLKLFNRGGYVLNFSTPTFDDFTSNVIGIELCTRYKLSKGKSLEQFVKDGTENEVIKLFDALLNYYEAQSEYISEINNKENNLHPLYAKCKEIMKRVSVGNDILVEHAEELKRKFSSNYLNQEIDLMYKMQKDNPTEAIGKAKELIESCCKTILEEKGVEINSKWDVGNLVDETMDLLEITPQHISDTTKEAKAIKGILGSLKGIASRIAIIRNTYGSGHGKTASYKGLQERHAKLAIGSSVTLVNFLWDSFERKTDKA